MLSSQNHGNDGTRSLQLQQGVVDGVNRDRMSLAVLAQIEVTAGLVHTLWTQLVGMLRGVEQWQLTL